MSLMQVLTTRDSFQSSTTPYAFLGGATATTFQAEPPHTSAATDNTSLYFSSTRLGGDHLTHHHHPRNGDHEVYSTREDLKLSSGGDSSKPGGTSIDQQAKTSSMNTNLQHVAQQSRREKLRIPGSLQQQQQPASPQSGGGNDRSQPGGGGGGDIHHHHHHHHQAEHESIEASVRGYGGNTGQDAMLSVYSSQMLAPELYSYTSGTDLLNAVSGKNQGYILTGSSDPGGVVYNAAGQAGGFSSGHSNVIGKGGGAAWPAGGGGGGGFAANSLSIPSMPQPGAFGSTTGRDLGAYFAGGGGGSGGGGAPNAQEAMQLYLMNAAAAAAAGYGGFGASSGDASTASAPGSMVFIPGPSSGAVSPQQQQQQQQQQMIGAPLHSSQNSLSQTSQVTSVSNSPVAYQSGRSGGSQYSGWKSSDELVFMPGSERAKSSLETGGVVSDFSDYHHQAAAAAAAFHHMQDHQSQASGFQGLSLSLSSQQPPPLNAFDVIQQSGLDSQDQSGDHGKRGKLAADLSHFRRDFLGSGGGGAKVHVPDAASATPAMSASFSIISSSRYLKACQQLLEEVCSVGRGGKQKRTAAAMAAVGSSPLTSPTSAGTTATGNNPATTSNDQSAAAPAPAPDPAPASSSQELSTDKDAASAGNSAAPASSTSPSGKTTPPPVTGAGSTGAGTASAAAASTEGGVESASTLSAEEKQDLESKKSKLIGMLQEVDRRYRQYYDQMQVVISSFDAVAGVGAATPYTALALQAMSRYFRCLKDAITGQISLVCKSLGEEDISKQITTKSPTSRLRFIDQQIRQQRAFQQLGMLNQHAWRPQRGLPERSVSILRAWLFEHFLHPYPKDADKMMLARQTGLTRSQVSNWFINARVRLWKPMVEEMYQEETREHDLDAAVARMHAENEENELKNSAADALADPKSNKQLLPMDQQDFIHENSPVDYRKHQQQQQQSMVVGSSPADLYDDSGVQQQLKKSRYHDPSSDFHHHQMDVDLKPDSDEIHGYGGGGGGYHDQSLRFSAANPGFRYNLNPSQGGSGVSLTLGLQHSDSSLGGVIHPAAAAAYLQPQGFHALTRGGGGSGGGGGGGDDFSSLYENAAAAAAGLHDGMNYTSRKHMESQLLHDFVPS